MESHRALNVEVDAEQEIYNVDLKIPNFGSDVVQFFEDFAAKQSSTVLSRIERMFQSSPNQPEKFVDDKPGWWRKGVSNF